MAIVQKIYLLDSIFIVTLVAYIADVFLFYFKTWKPFWATKASVDIMN